jgi:hypothetical protein
MSRVTDDFIVEFDLAAGLFRGGADHATAIMRRESEHSFVWVDRMPGHSCLCGFRIVRYQRGFLRVKALEAFYLQNDHRVSKWFLDNALSIHGFRELTYLKEELLESGAIEELGYFFARLVRGEMYRISLFADPGPETPSTYPDYCFTNAAWAAI